MAKFLFNRIHLESSEKIENKIQFLLDGLISKSATSHNKHAYKLLDVQLKEDFISGYLIKYDPYSESEVFDEDSESLITGAIRNKIVAKSLFIIVPSESIIMFEIVSNEISKFTFQNRLKELFELNQAEKRTATLNLSEITEKYSFLTRIKELRKIEKISLKLVPSNPRFADRWKDIDERLRKNNIGSYKEVQETKNRGGIELDDETEDKILMSEDGYGVAKANGLDANGKFVELNTRTEEKVISKDVPRNTIESGADFVFRFLSETIEKIKDRTKNE